MGNGRFLGDLTIPVAVLLCVPFGATGQPVAALRDGDRSQLEGDLQVWGWNIAAASLDNLVPGFRKRCPDVDVHVNLTGANLQSRFLLSLSAGVGAPDVSQLQLREAPRYEITQRLTDLTAVAKPYEREFPASLWKNCTYEGKVYAIPWDMGPCAVFYRRGLFGRYGIDPEAIETWDDYLAAGKAFLEKSNGETKLLCLPTGGLDETFLIILQQQGGQVFDNEGRIALDSTEAARTLDVLRKLLEAGVSTNTRRDDHAFFASMETDRVATYPTAAWFGGLIRDHAPDTSGDWGVFRLPAVVPGGLRTSNLGGSVLVIPDQCPQKEAAWAYVEYALCTPEAQITQYRDYDLFPALLSTHRDPFFDEPVPFFGNQKVRRLFCRDIEKIPPMNRTKDWMEASRYLAQSLSKWAATGMGPSDEFLGRLTQKMARRLGRDVTPET